MLSRKGILFYNRSMNNKFFPILTILFGMFFVVMPARADDGPDVSYLGATEPIEESVIQMQKEQVEFTVPKEMEDTIPGKATFWFHNPTSESVTQPSFFPMTFEGPGEYFEKSYAENIRVKVNGVAVKGQVKYSEYPYRDGEDGDLSRRKSEGYSFPFTVPANSTIVVEVMFDAPLDAVQNATGFNYFLGSGAGWAGNIQEAKFVVDYPYELQQGWVTANFQPGDETAPVDETKLSDRTFSFTLKDIEPTSGRDVIRFFIILPRDAEMLMKAQEGMENFDHAWQWYALAEAYRSFRRFRPWFYNTWPDFALRGYWEAIDKALELEGIDPDSHLDLHEAIRLAALYSDDWDLTYSSFDSDLTDADGYRKVMASLEEYARDAIREAEYYPGGLTGRSQIKNLLAWSIDWMRARSDLFSKEEVNDLESRLVSEGVLDGAQPQAEDQEVENPTDQTRVETQSIKDDRDKIVMQRNAFLALCGLLLLSTVVCAFIAFDPKKRLLPGTDKKTVESKKRKRRA